MLTRSSRAVPRISIEACRRTSESNVKIVTEAPAPPPRKKEAMLALTSGKMFFPPMPRIDFDVSTRKTQSTAPRGCARTATAMSRSTAAGTIRRLMRAPLDSPIEDTGTFLLWGRPHKLRSLVSSSCGEELENAGSRSSAPWHRDGDDRAVREAQRALRAADDRVAAQGQHAVRSDAVSGAIRRCTAFHERLRRGGAVRRR